MNCNNKEANYEVCFLSVCGYYCEKHAKEFELNSDFKVTKKW